MIRATISIAITMMGLSSAAAQTPRNETLPAPVASQRSQADVREAAEIRMRLYEKIDYRMELARLDTRIRVAEAKARMLRRRLIEYRQFAFNAMALDIEYAQLALLEAELEVKNLRQEKHLWQSYRGDLLRLQKIAR